MVNKNYTRALEEIKKNYKYGTEHNPTLEFVERWHPEHGTERKELEEVAKRKGWR